MANKQTEERWKALFSLLCLKRACNVISKALLGARFISMLLANLPTNAPMAP